MQRAVKARIYIYICTNAGIVRRRACPAAVDQKAGGKDIVITVSKTCMRKQNVGPLAVYQGHEMFVMSTMGTTRNLGQMTVCVRG
jgi:hypothetical protein